MGLHRNTIYAVRVKTVPGKNHSGHLQNRKIVEALI